ncbi:hypothetical protein EC82524_5607B, partial [Escherichia coli 8.2524]
WHS